MGSDYCGSHSGTHPEYTKSRFGGDGEVQAVLSYFQPSRYYQPATSGTIPTPVSCCQVLRGTDELVMADGKYEAYAHSRLCTISDVKFICLSVTAPFNTVRDIVCTPDLFNIGYRTLCNKASTQVQEIYSYSLITHGQDPLSLSAKGALQRPATTSHPSKPLEAITNCFGNTKPARGCVVSVLAPVPMLFKLRTSGVMDTESGPVIVLNPTNMMPSGVVCLPTACPFQQANVLDPPE